MNSSNELTWAEQYIQDHKSDPDYILFGVNFSISEQIAVYIDDNNISRTELAQRMGCSKAYITKLLSGTYNYTIETLIKISVALDLELKVELAPKAKAKKKIKYDYEQPVKKVAEGK